MVSYAGQASKAGKKFENTAKEATIAGAAQTFLSDATGYAGEMASEGAKFIRDEGKKDLRKASAFFRDHPVQATAYAVGIGAVLSYFLMPRK